MRLLHQWNTTPGQALALNRNALVHKFGHLVSLLWARLILGRFRDVVSHLPFEAATNAAEVPNDEDPLHFFCAPQGKLIHRQVKAKAERENDFDRTY